MDFKTSEAQRRSNRNYQKNNYRLNLILPNGTKERITALGFKPATFVKELVLSELDRLEKLNSK